VSAQAVLARVLVQVSAQAVSAQAVLAQVVSVLASAQPGMQLDHHQVSN
jgi:hypothetical protein